MLSRLDDPMEPGRPLIVFLGDDVDEMDHDLMFPALRRRGVSVVRVHPHELVTYLDGRGATFAVAGRPLEPDLVVGWVLDDLLLPGMAQLDVMARAGIAVINDALTLFRAQNKDVNSSMSSAGGVLRYPVICGRDASALAEWLGARDGRAVVKPLTGYGGRGLERLEPGDDGGRLVERLRAEDAAYYVVPWIENPGRDIRVYTVNHRAVFAMYRFAPPGRWITNVRAGGAIGMCPVDADLAELAERASRAAGTLLGGVDIAENLETGELVVYEVNSCPTSEPPVLEIVADFLAAAVDDLPSALARWRPDRVYDRLDPDPALFHASQRDRIVG